VTVPAEKRGWLAGWALVTLAGLALLLPACESDGHFTILGYTTKPNYDMRFHTVRVPIFRNRTFWTTTTVPGLEMDLTQAVVREIELNTPYKVKQTGADTELLGTIVGFTKAALSYNQFNYQRELETTLIVELIWRDLRTGEILSRAARRPGEPLPTDRAAPLLGAELQPLPGARSIVMPSAPTLPSVGPADEPLVPLPRGPDGKRVAIGPDGTPIVLGADGKPVPLDPTGRPIIPIVLRSVGHFIPELGGSITTGQQECINRMAKRITEMMEKGW
jgi:hypothetical protein